jgi:signal transduction histidine kinase
MLSVKIKNTPKLSETAMKKIQTLFRLSLFIILLASHSGNAHPFKVSEFDTHKPIPVAKEVFTIGKNLDYYEDTSRAITIERIGISEYPWRKEKKTSYNLGLSRSAHWFHGSLSHRDVDTSIHQWSLIVGEFGFDSVQCFIVKKGLLVKKMEVGTKILPSSECRLSKHFIAFPIDFTADSTVEFYLRVIAVNSEVMVMNLTSKEEFLRLHHNSTSITLVLLGMIVFAVFYNTIVWGKNKDATFYLHTAMLITTFITLIHEYFFVVEELLPVYPTRVYDVRLFLITVQSIGIAFFFTTYLQTKAFSRVLHQTLLLSYLFPACLVTIILYSVNLDELIGKIVPIFFIWGLIVAITIIFRMWRKRGTLSRLFMVCFIGNSFVILTLNVLRAYFNSTLDYVNIYVNLNSFGGPFFIAVNIILSTFILAFRIIDLRSRFALEQQHRIHVEKERLLIQEQNAELQSLNLELQRQQEFVEEQSAELELKNTVLQEQLETINRTQTQLAQAEKMASLGTLVAGVAHELNTPIGVAVTAASTLDVRTKDFVKRYQEGGLKKSELDAYVQTAQMGADLTLRNLERAANLIQSFKQVAVDQTTDNKRRIGVKSYIAGIITSLEPKWKTTRHRVELVCDETLEMETYPGAIAQIITNLIDNSLLHGFQGYTEEGIMRIKVENQDPNNQVTITYSDNGKGIPQEVLPKIFDPFFTTKQAQGGTGLGMHIVYNLVTQKLGGEILCENAGTLSGATFSLTFPVKGS